MKNKLNTAIAALFVATTSMTVSATEGDSKWYVGVGGTTGAGTYSATAAIANFSASASVDYDSSSVPIKIGLIMDNSNRLELSYQSIKESDSSLEAETVSGVNLDYKLLIEEPKVGSFTPYGVVGLGLYEWENTAQYFVGDENLEGIQWGAGVGGVYGVDNSLELETSLQYKKINWQDVKVGAVTITSDNSGYEFYLGLNYKL
mgnify:FL=1|jgi:opacity protein-like surface antigen